MTLLIPNVLPVFIPLVALPLGMAALSGLLDDADRFAAARNEERAVLHCARFAAAMRNLDAARSFLASRHPQYAARLSLAVQDLEADLLPAPPLPPPGAAGRCVSDGPRRLVASLHLERHPGQPDPWPNWIVRWEGAGP